MKRLVPLVLLLLQHTECYSYSGRLTYGSYNVGPAEQIRLNHITNPQPYLAYYGGKAEMPDPPSACTISWVSQLVAAKPKVYQSNSTLQGDNATAYLAQVQFLEEDSEAWGKAVPGYASIYVENRCGTVNPTPHCNALLTPTPTAL